MSSQIFGQTLDFNKIFNAFRTENIKSLIKLTKKSKFDLTIDSNTSFIRKSNVKIIRDNYYNADTSQYNINRVRIYRPRYNPNEIVLEIATTHENIFEALVGQLENGEYSRTSEFYSDYIPNGYPNYKINIEYTEEVITINEERTFRITNRHIYVTKSI